MAINYLSSSVSSSCSRLPDLWKSLGNTLKHGKQYLKNFFGDFSIDEKTIIRGSFLQDLENKDESYEQNKFIIKPH